MEFLKVIEVASYPLHGGTGETSAGVASRTKEKQRYDAEKASNKYHYEVRTKLHCVLLVDRCAVNSKKYPQNTVRSAVKKDKDLILVEGLINKCN